MGVLLGSLLLLGCAGADWKKVDVASGYKAPKEVTVVLKSSADGKGHEEAFATLKQAMADTFADHDVKAKFVESSGEAETDISMVEWDPGNRALRWLGFGGAGRVLVVVKSTGVNGSAEGWINSGSFGGDANNAAEEAGVLIAETIATGQTGEE
jgi:hypothetical protein